MSIDWSGLPDSVVIQGPAPNPTYPDYAGLSWIGATVPADGTMAFDWAFTGGSGYALLYFGVNHGARLIDSRYQPTDGASGSVSGIEVRAGDRFEIWLSPNTTRPVLTVSNIAYTRGSVTALPAVTSGSKPDLSIASAAPDGRAVLYEWGNYYYWPLAATIYRASDETICLLGVMYPYSAGEYDSPEPMADPIYSANIMFIRARMRLDGTLASCEEIQVPFDYNGDIWDASGSENDPTWSYAWGEFFGEGIINSDRYLIGEQNYCCWDTADPNTATGYPFCENLAGNWFWVDLDARTSQPFHTVAPADRTFDSTLGWLGRKNPAWCEEMNDAWYYSLGDTPGPPVMDPATSDVYFLTREGLGSQYADAKIVTKFQVQNNDISLYPGTIDPDQTCYAYGPVGSTGNRIETFTYHGDSFTLANIQLVSERVFDVHAASGYSGAPTPRIRITINSQHADVTAYAWLGEEVRDNLAAITSRTISDGTTIQVEFYSDAQSSNGNPQCYWHHFTGLELYTTDAGIGEYLYPYNGIWINKAQPMATTMTARAALFPATVGGGWGDDRMYGGYTHNAQLLWDKGTEKLWVAYCYETSSGSNNYQLYLEEINTTTLARSGDIYGPIRPPSADTTDKRTTLYGKKLDNPWIMHNGRLFVAWDAADGGFACYDIDTATLGAEVTPADSAGTVWYGSTGPGMLHLSGKSFLLYEPSGYAYDGNRYDFQGLT